MTWLQGDLIYDEHRRRGRGTPCLRPASERAGVLRVRPRLCSWLMNLGLSFLTRVKSRPHVAGLSAHFSF